MSLVRAVLGVAALARGAGAASFSAEEVKLAQLLADIAAVIDAASHLTAEPTCRAR